MAGGVTAQMAGVLLQDLEKADVITVGQSAKNWEALPCFAPRSRRNRAFIRTASMFAPLRTVPRLPVELLLAK
jgi:hypothetical protein